MKLVILLVLCTITKLSPLYAIGAPDATAAIIVQTKLQTVWNSLRTSYDSFMKTKIMAQVANTIQMTKTLHNNYLDSKRYYDMIYRLSKHEGGFLGYAAEAARDKALMYVASEKSRIMAMREGDRNNLVRRSVEKWKEALTPGDIGWNNLSMDLTNGKYATVKEIEIEEKFLDLMQKFTETSAKNAEKRDKKINETLKEANKPMDSKTMEETKVKVMAHQIEILQDIDVGIRTTHQLLVQQQKDSLRQKTFKKLNMEQFVKNMEDSFKKQKFKINDKVQYNQKVMRVLEATPNKVK